MCTLDFYKCDFELSVVVPPHQQNTVQEQRENQKTEGRISQLKKPTYYVIRLSVCYLIHSSFEMEQGA